MKLLEIGFTGFDATFDLKSILLVAMGILVRFCYEWYKNSKDLSVPYNINWREQVSLSLLIAAVYVVTVLMMDHHFTLMEAFGLGFVPQTVLNMLEGLGASKVAAAIKGKPKVVAQMPEGDNQG